MVKKTGSASFLNNSLKRMPMPIWIFNSDRIIISDNYTPASADAKGDKGTITWDENYIYICVDKNTWKRIGISTWV